MAARPQTVAEIDPAIPTRPLHLRDEELPELRLLDYGVQAEGHRDLFAFVKPDRTPETALPASVIASMPPPRIETQDSDLLPNLKVIGLVSRSGEVTVLLQVGTTLKTVGLGEPFGAGDTLRVTAIEGRNVAIMDNIAKTSKTYLLSEE